MTRREVRMRCIEAICREGIREVKRVLNDARELEEWVLSAEDEKQETARRGRPPKQE